MKLTNQGGKFWLRDLSFEELSKDYDTPFYLYDLVTVDEKINEIRNAFGNSLELYYAVKANPNLELLKSLKNKVDGLDIASGGELELAINAGYNVSNLSFASPGKTKKELAKSLQNKIGYISVESERELNQIIELVEEGAPRASILLRINPDLFIKEFAIKMGGKASPFGIEEQELGSAIALVANNPEVFDFKGIHVYSGTQCLSAEHLAHNLRNILSIAARTLEFDIECSVINIGGGFGVPYYNENDQLDIQELAGLFKKEFNIYHESTGTTPKIILELGRFLVAEAGIYVTRIISEKISRGEQFFVLDGGMNHHLAASGNLGATIRKNYRVRNLSRADAPFQTCSLVGPLCTPMDLMGKSVSIGAPEIGDLVGFLASGSYGYSASPLLFLGHELPAEIIVSK